MSRVCSHVTFVDPQQLSVLQVVFAHALRRQFSRHVVQVVGVGVSVTREVRAEFGFVVNLVPNHRVRLSRGAGRPDGEDQATIPCRDEQLQHLREETEKSEVSGV